MLEIRHCRCWQSATFRNHGVFSGMDIAFLNFDYDLAGVLKCLDQFEVQSSR